MNEPKDDLLAAFENPESVPSAEVTAVQGAPVPEAAPVTEVPVAPVIPEVAPIETPVAPAPEASPVVENIMPAEFANAPAATPIPEASPVVEAPASTSEVVAPEVAPVVETPVTQVVETAVAETPAVETPVEDNQNVPAQVSEEPAITVKNTVTPEQEDPNFLKKNIKFIILFCVIIAVFIIFLPKILSLLSGGAY